MGPSSLLWIRQLILDIPETPTFLGTNQEKRYIIIIQTVTNRFLKTTLFKLQGFEHTDPFIPIEVTNYNDKEIHSQIDYYAERKWLQQPKAVTEKGRGELTFMSARNPFTLMNLVAPY